MKRETFERLVNAVLRTCKDDDYPLCYTKQGQILTLKNNVLYIGSVDDAKNISSECNRQHYQQDK